MSNTDKLLLDLDWNWKNVRSEDATEKYYDAEFSDDEKDVFRCHLFEIDHLQLLKTISDTNYRGDDRIPSDPRTGKIYPNFVIDSSMVSAVPKIYGGFTVKSKLKASVHKACIRALIQMQIQFRHNSGSNAQPGTIVMTETERNDLEQYMTTYKWRQSEQVAFQEFVRHHFLANYASLVDRVSPCLIGYVSDKWKETRLGIILGHSEPYIIQTAISLINGDDSGEVSLSVGDTIYQSGRILGYEVLKKLFRPSASQLFAIESMSLRIYSRIPDVGFLENCPNIVISLASVQRLVDYPAYGEEAWMMPFRVVENEDFQKKCYIDDPLPDAVLSLKDRNRDAIRCQVRACAIQEQSPVSYCLTKRQYGHHSSETRPTIRHEDYYQLVPFNEYLAKNTIRQSEYSIEPPQKLLLADLNDGSTDPLRIILRLNPTAFDATRPENPPTLINVSTKLEYQPEFGAEQMTASELIGEWCSQILQPNSLTDRYRIVAHSGHIMSVTRLTQSQIESEMVRLHKIRPNVLLQRLNQILRTISRLPPNTYLLRHSSKHGNRSMVYTQTESKLQNSLDLQQMYAADMEAALSLNKISWTPIDDMEVTQIHQNAQVAPCAFPAFIKTTPNTTNMPKKSIVRNDRKHILTRAHTKLLNKQKAKKTTAASALRKRKATQKKQTTSVSMARRAMMAKPIGETIDPYLVFDDQGNMLVNGLLTTPNKSSKENITMQTRSQLHQQTLNYQD